MIEIRKALGYSEYLLQQSPTPRVQEPPLAGARGEYVHDQAVRRAVIVAYDRRRGLCGIKIVTLDGRTAVDAAHIKPWHVSHDDRPANGMALCRLCHWAFHAGMLGIRRDYEVLTSPEIASAGNIAAHLGTLSGRRIVGPAEERHWPDVEAVDWHRKHVFRGR